MKSKMSIIEWVLLVFIAVVVDITQLVLDFLLIGPATNPVIDITVGIALPTYLHLRGVSMANSKRLLAMLATFFGEIIPGVDTLPLWTADVIVIWMTVIAEKKLAESQSIDVAPEEFEPSKDFKKEPVNKDGSRLPPPRSQRTQIPPQPRSEMQQPSELSSDRQNTPNGDEGSSQSVEQKKPTEQSLKEQAAVARRAEVLAARVKQLEELVKYNPSKQRELARAREEYNQVHEQLTAAYQRN